MMHDIENIPNRLQPRLLDSPIAVNHPYTCDFTSSSINVRPCDPDSNLLRVINSRLDFSAAQVLTDRLSTTKADSSSGCFSFLLKEPIDLVSSVALSSYL
jgi:hypothetical protein